MLTAVNTGRRSFLGGVSVEGTLDVPLLVPWSRCRTLREAIVDLRGVISDCAPGVPRIVIGGGSIPLADSEFAVRATFDGWQGGVAPLYHDVRLPERQEYVPAGVLAGALGVSEAFQFVRGDNAVAGRRDVGLSLWQPDKAVNWLEAGELGPPLERLPASAWIIGLGHLGQAFLWTLGLLPYASPEEVSLVLQDFDELVEANDSTSLLTTRALLGEKKTRAMAAWCESRGFRTSIVERRFAGDFRVAGDEPRVALCGVDNALARADLEDVGFDRVIEAGLGAGSSGIPRISDPHVPGGPFRKASLGDARTPARCGCSGRQSGLPCTSPKRARRLWDHYIGWTHRWSVICRSCHGGSGYRRAHKAGIGRTSIRDCGRQPALAGATPGSGVS